MNEDTAVQALSALAQRHRLAVFRLLVRQGTVGACPGEIGLELGLSPATLSFHLRTLSQAGLVTAEQRGRSILYRAGFDAMNALLGYLGENCCAADDDSCAVGASACAPKPTTPVGPGSSQPTLEDNQ